MNKKCYLKCTYVKQYAITRITNIKKYILLKFFMNNYIK